ncbi:MAG: hypothetical protein QXN35_01050 [Ignisphaera sp.]
MSDSGQYVVVEKKRSTASVLLLLVVVINAISILFNISVVTQYMSKINEIERSVDRLYISINALDRSVSELSSSYKPINMVMDIYVKYTAAKMISELFGIQFDEAFKIVSEYGKQTSTSAISATNTTIVK